MIVHSVLFGDNPDYERMACVLKYTIGRNSPATPFVLHRITEPDEDLIEAINKRPYNRKSLYLNNARKTKHHCRIVNEAKNGEVLCLMDADVMVLGDLSSSPLGENDVLLTHRPRGSAYPANTGVVVVRINNHIKRLYRNWLGTVVQMLSDLEFHMRWKPLWGGINQSALGAMLDQGIVGPLISETPCQIWNCETECHKRGLFDERTKVVHVIGNLHRHLFDGERATNETVEKLAGIWREYERQAMGAAA